MSGIGVGGSSSSSSSLADRLKRFDLDTAVLDEFRVRTSQGATLSAITIVVILYLTYAEYTFNLHPTVIDRVHVNATSPSGLEIEFDVTFPHIPCALLSIDAADPTGQSQSLHIDRTHRVWKHRLNDRGKLIGRKSKFELGNTISREDHLLELVNMKLGDIPEKRTLLDGEEDEDGEGGNGGGGDGDSSKDGEEECGSCYGAGDPGECCNTCDDVKRAYRRKGWQIADLDKVAACRTLIRSRDEINEGCNVHGIVALSTGGGNIHMTPGHELEHFGEENKLTLNDIIQSTFETFNVTHTVNKLHFGTDFPGNVYQLDEQRRSVKDSYVMYQYYIQIVPTLYKFLNGTSIQTNQFSVTEHERHVHPGTGRGLPGIFFFYEVSALHVEIEEVRLGWIRFWTSICAVVGGVFTVMGMIDKALYYHSSSKSRGKGGSRLG